MRKSDREEANFRGFVNLDGAGPRTFPCGPQWGQYLFFYHGKNTVVTELKEHNSHSYGSWSL